jgi:hypothetical protein
MKIECKKKFFDTLTNELKLTLFLVAIFDAILRIDI